jgi:hypothetical protein
MALRVFISSTMEDLENERDAVARKLREFNMEPVNAEGWLPDGTGSWTRIVEELEASDLFVLLLGKSYGWIPASGPMSGAAKSVTELEYLKAREQKIPVLPFVKTLPYNAERDTADARKRDELRRQVMAWEDGQFIATFNRAYDLSAKVGEALIQVITREYLKTRVQRRLEAKQRPGGATRTAAEGEDRLPEIPQSLMNDVRARRAVLFAGAGMSLPAGLPTAAAFAQYLRESIRDLAPDYQDAAFSFASAAADLQAVASRHELVTRVKEMLHPPQGLNHTFAHDAAVRTFDQIFTTNWDNLFEQALGADADDRAVICTEIERSLPPRALLKLHGGLDDEDSLIMTEADIALMAAKRPQLWAETRRTLREKTLVVVGMSLRDTNMIELLEDSAPLRGGYFVAPIVDTATRARLARWNLIPIEATANAFFSALSTRLQSERAD